MPKKQHNRFKFNRVFSEEPLQKPEWSNLEDLLARLIAQAYAEEHPESFQTTNSNHSSDQVSSNEKKSSTKEDGEN